MTEESSWIRQQVGLGGGSPWDTTCASEGFLWNSVYRGIIQTGHACDCAPWGKARGFGVSSRYTSLPHSITLSGSPQPPHRARQLTLKFRQAPPRCVLLRTLRALYAMAEFCLQP